MSSSETELSIFIVGRQRSLSAGGVFIAGANNSNYDNAEGDDWTKGDNWWAIESAKDSGFKNSAYMSSDNIGTSKPYKDRIYNGAVDTDFHVQSFIWLGGANNYNCGLTTMSLRVDDVVLTKPPGPDGGIWHLRARDEIDIGGKDVSGTDLSTDIDIAEILIYNKALSSGDRQVIHDYLNSKYGL